MLIKLSILWYISLLILVYFHLSKREYLSTLVLLLVEMLLLALYLHLYLHGLR